MANNTEQEAHIVYGVDLAQNGGDESALTIIENGEAHIINGKTAEVVLHLIEAEATRARIDELERINPTTEWTLSASARQSTIGERIAELKRQAEGGK